jgi:hypothetical protein
MLNHILNPDFFYKSWLFSRFKIAHAEDVGGGAGPTHPGAPQMKLEVAEVV